MQEKYYEHKNGMASVKLFFIFATNGIQAIKGIHAYKNKHQIFNQLNQQVHNITCLFVRNI